MMGRVSTLLMLMLVLAAATLGGGGAAAGPALGSSPDVGFCSGAIRLPDGHVPEPLDRGAIIDSVPADQGVKAVAIVGDVGSSTPGYRAEMDEAAAALQGYGVVVTKFYYGVHTFGWAEVVAAAHQAHFLLYMGHGVYSGDLPYPTWVGGFYFGSGEFVSPDQIRNDLAGVMAPDSMVIFSHACFTAGSSAGDPADLAQSEAQRRVTMYADPFTDIGMQAYFANNYFHSAAQTVDQVFAGATMEDVFKGGVGYNPANFRDLSYPLAGYDLWLDGTPGSWHLAFVGIPDYVFDPAGPPPELGNLPDSFDFLYSIPDQRLLPLSVEMRPSNVGSEEPLTWTVTITGSWFTADPLGGTSPDSFRISPTTFSTDTVGVLTGEVLVTVVDPPDVANSPHRVDLSLHVIDQALEDVFLPLALREEGG